MQGNYQNKIIEFYKTKKRLPTYREIMKIVGFKSTNAVHKLVSKLVDEGVLVRDREGKLAPSRIFGEVGILGSIKAGFPSPAEEELQDTMSLDEFLIDHKEATFILKVDGDSMIDAHIADGDMVIVERTQKAKDGDIVVAEVDGEWTMKYFRNKEGKVWLEAANKKYTPIYPENELKIAAKVKAVVRKYK